MHEPHPRKDATGRARDTDPAQARQVIIARRYRTLTAVVRSTPRSSWMNRSRGVATGLSRSSTVRKLLQATASSALPGGLPETSMFTFSAGSRYSARGSRAPSREVHDGASIQRCAGTTLDINVLLFQLLNMVCALEIQGRRYGLGCYDAALIAFRHRLCVSRLPGEI